MQPKALERSVRTAPKALLLSVRFFIFWPSVKGCVVHWIFVWNRIETLIKVIQNIHWFVDIYTFHIILIYFDINTDRSVVILILFLHTGATSSHFRSSGKKPLSKHSLKFYIRKPPKVSLNSLTVLSGMSLDFETFVESNRLIAMDICSLSTFLKVKVEFNFGHSFWIASILGWSLYLIINSSRL